MSRTKHHRGCRHRHCGQDFGARYNCDKGYSAGTGKDAKDRARSERRNLGRTIVASEIKALGD